MFSFFLVESHCAASTIQCIDVYVSVGCICAFEQLSFSGTIEVSSEFERVLAIEHQ